MGSVNNFLFNRISCVCKVVSALLWVLGVFPFENYSSFDNS